MFRFISILALLGALNVPVIAQPADASSASAARPKIASVVVWLKGSPVAADPALRARDKATRYHFRLDTTLAAARWYGAALNRYQDEEIAYLRGHGIDLTVQYRFHLLFNGFEATLPSDQVGMLRGSLNVSAVTFQRRPMPLDDHSFPLVNVPQAWSQVGGQPNAGKGVYIAQIDGGIDITNPCFSDKGITPSPLGRRGQLQYTNNKVVVARAFGPNPKVSYSAYDVSGHGTFGAGIEACDYGTQTPIGTTMSGIAPAAYLMSYNIFPKGSDQSTVAFDPVLPALEAAEQDGADVVNMSIGLGFGTDERVDPDEAAVRIMVASGTPVVISAGNDGPMPQSVTSPALAPDAISVGATSNDRALYASVNVQGPGAVPPALSAIEASQSSHPFTKSVGPAQMLYVGLARRPGDDPAHPSADDLAGKDLQGKIALVDRGGGVPSYTKMKNVQAMGAAGFIYLDNVNELNLGTLDAGTATIPTLFIGHNDGQALVQWVKDHPDATATLDPTLKSFPLPGDVLADFSSRGYGADYSITPDLVAPGVAIYSSAENETPNGDVYDPSGFASADGTSFSAPHVTGAVALLLQKFAHPTAPMVATRIGWVKSMLMDTANSDSVYLNSSKTTVPTVMDMGSGLLNVGAALASTAFLTPGSVSFGEANIGAGAVTRTSQVTLNDASGGSGSWQVSVQPLHGGAGVNVSAPSAVQLASGSHVSVPVRLSVASSTASGNYDGFVVFTQGTETLHVPYFVHVVSQRIQKGSVLLVDETTSLFQPDPSAAPIKHLDVTRYYTSALSAIGKRYTYWDQAKLGTPSLADMKQATAVVWYTGTNLNAWAPQNLNYEALQSPLSSADVTVIDQYLAGGGKLFLTGMGASLADYDWLGAVIGTVGCDLSMYDTDRSARLAASSPCPAEPVPPKSARDKKDTGRISPPKPSAIPASGRGVLKHVSPFAGIKPIDFSSKGDGARDNVAVYNPTLGALIGVTGIAPISGNLGFQGHAYGSWGLAVPKAFGTMNVATVSSDEPSLKRSAPYRGRSVLFSFGFEGINDNTGYATRAQVMKRIFQWFADRPSVSVSASTYTAGHASRLGASVHAGAPAKAAVYTWRVGSRTLKATNGPTRYTFPHPGRYRLRVQVTDNLGHAAVSGWKTVVVR